MIPRARLLFAGLLLLRLGPAAALDAEVPPLPPVLDLEYDMTLWSEDRIDQWEEAAASGIPLTRSMLFLPGESVPVPIFAGTSDHVMDLGAGQLTQFSNPGEIGNFVVAAHRDGFFRSLKDIEVGDELRAIDRDGEYRYRVDDITIVEPSNVDVLASDGGATITLVTCYPFYFQGSAPNRFIVRGSLVGEPSEAESPAGTATVDPFASAHDR